MYEGLNLQMTCGAFIRRFRCFFRGGPAANFQRRTRQIAQKFRQGGKRRTRRVLRCERTRARMHARARACKKAAALMTAAGLSPGSSIIPNDICRSCALFCAHRIFLCVYVSCAIKCKVPPIREKKAYKDGVLKDSRLSG